MELYCKNCDCHTNHNFVGNFKDGIDCLVDTFVKNVELNRKMNR